MSTQQASGGQWQTQLGTYLGAVACALALYALLRDNPNARTETRDTLAEEVHFRDTIAKLQESMALAENGGSEQRTSAARCWIYYQSAQEQLKQSEIRPALSAYLVLASFAYGHSDLEQAQRMVSKAESELKNLSSPVTQCLAMGALAHMQFHHAPKTLPAEGRKWFTQALAGAAKLPAHESAFISLGLLQEWTLDEYSTGNEAAGDEHRAAALELLKSDDFTPRYRTSWEEGLDTAIIQAKVRGGLL